MNKTAQSAASCFKYSRDINPLFNNPVEHLSNPFDLKQRYLLTRETDHNEYSTRFSSRKFPLLSS
jgi:hypothetical protein